MSHQVFICHASEDKTIADAVCAFLEQERIPSWIAPRDILPADDYGKAIVQAITSSRLVVLVFSSSANSSPHIRRELELAVSNGIPILPFRVEDEIPSESLQYYLGGIHWLDALTPPLEEHLRHLAGTVRVLLDRNDAPLRGNRAAAAAASATAAGAAADAGDEEPAAAESGPVPTPPTSSGATRTTPVVPPPAAEPAGAAPPPPAPPAAAPASGAAPPPAGRRGGMSVVTWVLIGIGGLVLVVGAGIALALALTSGGSTPQETEAGPEASTESDAGTGTDDPAETDDPTALEEEEQLMALSEQSCELLDPADVAAVYGADADPGTPAGDGYCDFALFQSITVWEEDADETDLAFWRETVDVEGIVDLPDVGGGAFQEPNGTLTVLDPNRGIIFLMITGGSSPEDYQRLVDLAELIVADG